MMNMDKENSSQLDAKNAAITADVSDGENTTSTDATEDSTTSLENEKSKIEKKPTNKKVIALVGVTLALVLATVAVIIGLGYRVISVKAKYEGDTVSGTILDKYNSGIVVEARTKNGQIHTIALGKWSITSPKTLEPDKSSRVIITYKNLSCDLTVVCSDSSAVDIAAYYNGKAEAGTVISNITDGFAVMATLKNNSKIDVTDKCTIVGGPITLEANKVSNIAVAYTDPLSGKMLTTSIAVSCTTRTVNKISAKYTGAASAGEVLDESNTGIIVTAVFNNGDVEVVSGWTVESPATLEESQISTVCINYGEAQCKLTVECSSIDPDTYCNNCSYVSYNELMRNPEKYENTLVRVSGKVYHIETGANTTSGYIYKIRVGSNQYVNVALNGEVEEVFLQDDYINCYGEFKGIDTSDYEDVPIVSAKYITSGY